MLKVVAPVIAVIGLLTANVSVQSLAEAARAAEAARRRHPAARAYTNDDLVPGRRRVRNASPQDGRAVGTALTSIPSAVDTAVGEENDWHARMRDLRVQFESDEQQRVKAVTAVQSLLADVYKGPHRRPTLALDIERAEADVIKWQAIVDEDRRAIDDLLAAARRANVPDAWLQP